MCGRFVIKSNKKDIIEKFLIDDSQLTVIDEMDNIPPTTEIPIIYQTIDKRVLSYGYWGLIPAWAKDKSFASNTFNARSETVSEKPSFREAYKQRRCLIPASAYYEWEKISVNGKLAGKQPYSIQRKDKALFAFAGLYEHWIDNQSGEKIRSCTIITREAYPKINHIHPRMPVILPEESYQAWLDATLDDFPMLDQDLLDYDPLATNFNRPSTNYEFNF